MESFPSEGALYGSSLDDEPVLEGNITVTGTAGGNSGTPEFNTLDEPISQTIRRDLAAIGSKFLHVIYPVEKKSLLREWDLWGPLILCTFMATVLQGHDTETVVDGEVVDGGPKFAEVFVIVWMGSLIVTLNTKLLGGNISIFQSICVLGYCLFPLAISLLVCRVLLFFSEGTLVLILRMVSVLVGFVWSTFASMQFLGDCSPKEKKIMSTYPMMLFYLVISWIIISHSN